ncbi:unnamed protein product [Ilex paraguariensis]|uniref:Uncharacterized protein n=1 Tax=Ilex paraguariensis TaxID=185542 RepID=A0ABC8UQB7_9AQUA
MVRLLAGCMHCWRRSYEWRRLQPYWSRLGPLGHWRWLAWETLGSLGAALEQEATPGMLYDLGVMRTKA